MGNMHFAWDLAKAKANEVKHGVLFEEAQTAFLDDGGRLIDDPEHSGAEQRFILIGYSVKGQCLTVCHCYRREHREIRLISARPATKKEEATYWSFK